MSGFMSRTERRATPVVWSDVNHRDTATRSALPYSTGLAQNSGSWVMAASESQKRLRRSRSATEMLRLVSPSRRS